MVATAFELPAVDDGDEVELAAWLVEIGESVTEGQPIAEVETEKSVVEIELPYNGTVSELLVDEWTVVSAGQEIAIFEVEEAALDKADDADGSSVDDTDADDTGNEGQASAVETPEGRVFAPPRVRRLARELGVDIGSVEGTDESGRITAEDVRAAAESEPDDTGPKPFTPSGKSAVSKSGESVSGGGLADDSGPKPFEPSGKSAVSKRSDSSSTSVDDTVDEAGEPADHRSYYDTATVDELVELQSKLGAYTDDGVALEPLAFVLKALDQAHRSVDGLDIEASHIGIGVPTPEEFVVTEVRDVDEKTLREIAAELSELTEQATQGKVTTATNQGPQITVTTLGAFGDEYATPPLEAGQTVGVALGALEQRPVVEDGEVVAGETIPVSLAVAHDAADRTGGAALLNQLVALLEEPSRLLLDAT